MAKQKVKAKKTAKPRQAVKRNPPVVKQPVEPAVPPRHSPWRVICLAAGAAVLLWAAGGLLFGQLSIEGQRMAAVTPNAVLQQQVATHAAQYHVSIIDPEGHAHEFNLAQTGLTPDAAGSISQARRAERRPLQLFAWWRPVSVDLQLQIDGQAVARFINDHARIITKPAQDAKLSVVDGNVQVSAGVPGQQYSFADPAGALVGRAHKFSPQPLHMIATSLPPTATAQSLAAAKKQLQAVLDQKVTVVVGSKIITPSAADIGGWLIIIPQGASAAISVNQSAVQDYFKQLAGSQSTAPQSQVVSDATGAVLSAGVKGVVVGDISAASATVTTHLLEAKNLGVTLPVTQTAFKTVSAPTDGKWIEVDLSTKRLYAYDQGELVQTFLVSAGAPATPTVTGRYAIYAKYRSQDMSGANADGTGYFQPDVPYVNYFYRDYAIHGNYWRPASYFGNVNSSHGCVGVQVDAGAWIYSWAPVGTPVIVHT